MTYIKEGRFTTNDHAYVLIPKKNWINKINLRRFTFQFQGLFQNLATSKSDNATFTKDAAKKQKILVPPKEIQDKIAEKLHFIDDLLENLKIIKNKMIELLEYGIN